MQSIATPRIEAVPSVTVHLPPSFEQPAEPLRAPPPVVDGEIVATVDDYQPPSPPPSRRWRGPALVSALAVVSLVLGGALGLVLSPLLLASATITLTPEAHSLTTATSVSLPVRLFTADHESLRRTIAATGTATRPATAARGSITFYNALPAP